MKTLLEAHNGLSAILVDKSNYDGIWVSSLTHAAAKGLPDNELISLTERIALVREIRMLSSKMIVVDIDTGGNIEHIPYNIKGFLEAGADIVVIEDKKYPKQNSLLEENSHQLEDVDVFCDKIRVAKQFSRNMRIVARLESLIAKKSMEDALIRAKAYDDAGADIILIHSKSKIDSTEVMEFATKFQEMSNKPMMAIPTTYVLPEEHPFEIIVLANHMLRASMAAMQKVANGNEEQQTDLASVQDIFDLVGH